MNSAKNAWSKWKSFGKKAVYVQARILFTIFYFALLWIVAIPFKINSDPLNIKKMKGKKSNFSAWNFTDFTLSQAQKPF